MASKLICLALIVLLFSSLVVAQKKLAKKEEKHGYNNHEEEHKDYNNHEEEHKDEYKGHEEEEKGYKGGKKHRVNRITSAKWYKFCTYDTADTNCTERVSCAILENSKCHTLLDGYSVYLSVVGKKYLLLRFTDTDCTTVDTQTLASSKNYDLKDYPLEECHKVNSAPSGATVNYVVSPLRRRDYK